MLLTKLKSATVMLLGIGLLAVGSAPGQPPVTPSREKKTADERQNPAGAPTVRLARPQLGGLERTTRLPCNAEPFAQADLYPRVAGVVKAVNADIGDRVKAGQLLAEIDAPELALDERQAAVGVAQAESLLREAQGRIDGAKAEVVTAEGAVRQREAEAEAAKATLAFRKRQLDRMKSLVESKAVDQRLLDEAEDQHLAASEGAGAKAAAVEHAKAALAVTKIKVGQSQSAAETAKVSVEAAKLASERARLALARTRVVSPYAGVVVRRLVWTGETVRPDLPPAPGAPLFTVVRTDVIRVVFEIPDRFVPMVEVGVRAEVALDALPGVELTGKVSRFAAAEDPKARTMRTEIDIPNPDGKLVPGMPGTVVLKFGKGPTDALRVPAGAVVNLPRPQASGKANAVVYTFRDGKARLTRVQTGYSNGTEIEILSGLTAEDRVVLNPKVLSSLGEADIPVQVEPPEPQKK